MERDRLSKLAERVRIDARYGEAKLPYGQRDDWQRRAHCYRVTLRYNRRSYTFDWWQGEARTDDPTAAGCLECLLSDATGAEQSFDDWCGDYGYDTDSRKAERTYKACQRVAKAMRRLLGADYETFAYADRD